MGGTKLDREAQDVETELSCEELNAVLHPLSAVLVVFS
jgi:hypothetical protein